MSKKFSLLKELASNLKTIEDIDDSLKITLGPTGKNGIIGNAKGEIAIITTGSSLLKSLSFNSSRANILLKILEQAANKTHSVSGDGSTTTILIACELLKKSLLYLTNGYNSIFLSNGFKKVAHFLFEKSLEYSVPISNFSELNSVLTTALGKKLNPSLLNILKNSLTGLQRDGLILVEENTSPISEVTFVQGMELDRGYASSYFVNDSKNFEVLYDKPYLLIANYPINALNQVKEIIEFIKTNNKPLVIIAEEINKDIISTLVLNSIQKKIKIVVIKYSSIKYLKTGVLEDLAILTHSNYFNDNLKDNSKIYSINDLGQAEKVIVKKDKSTFLISKFSKLIAKRRINELNRELLLSETEYEKNIFKTRIARLSGNIAKIKIGSSNQYQIQEERQKIENAINTIRSALEEGILPGGGIFYFLLRNELKNWSYLNLIGDEIFSSEIVRDSLMRPFAELCSNTNNSRYKLLQQLDKLGYPYAYNFLENKYTHTIKEGLIDSAKSIRSILWNSLTIISTLITSD